MNDLQWNLIALGTVVVLGVFAYNKWQERRHRKVAERVFSREHDDVLLGEQAHTKPSETFSEGKSVRQEPVLGGYVLPDVRREPSLGETDEFPVPELSVVEDVVPYIEDQPPVVLPATASLANAVSPSTGIPADLLNPLCDGAIRFDLVSPLKAAEVLPLGQDAFNRCGVPVYWLGCSEQASWKALAAGMNGHFTHLVLVTQLATRRGPIQETAINLLVQTAEQIGVELNAVVDVSDMQDALHRGRKIDQFCADVDLQIGLNLVGMAPFLGTKIRALAEAAGMALNWQGGYELCDEHDLPLFTLINQESAPFSAENMKTLQTHGLTFVLDVPRVPDGAQVFDHMLRLAQQFAEPLQAHLVDDNRQPLNTIQLAGIRQQFVVQPQLEMASRGVAAGRSLALRLFS